MRDRFSTGRWTGWKPVPLFLQRTNWEGSIAGRPSFRLCNQASVPRAEVLQSSISRSRIAGCAAFAGEISSRQADTESVMAVALFIPGALMVAAFLLLRRGRWRIFLRPFHIRAHQLTTSALQLRVEGDENRQRVDNILAAFAGGFNRQIGEPSGAAWRSYAAGLPALYEPFVHEGAAMGYFLRRLRSSSPVDFENSLVRVRPDFRYLYYVGLGFWAGMRRWKPATLAAFVDELDPLHGYLCFDGYGFKHAFFDHPRKASALRVLEGFRGYARCAAYHGVGRAMYFRYFSAPEELVRQVQALGAHAVDAAAGVGLAATFVNPDRFALARQLGEHLPREWHAPYHLGMCFGLKARSINDVDEFERHVSAMSAPVRDAVLASIRECDRVELLVRADGLLDPYRRWRDTVTRWLTEHVQFPMQRLTSPAESLRPTDPTSGPIVESPSSLMETR